MDMAEAEAAEPAPSHAAGPCTGVFGVGLGVYNVAVALLVTMLLVGSTSYSFGLFVRPVAAEFGLGRAQVNVGMILFQIGSALYSPFVGRLADRYSARLLIRISGALLGAGLICVGLTPSLALMAFAMLGPIPLGCVLGSLAGLVVVSRSFQRARGRALTIAALGTSAGGLVTFPAIAFLVAASDWRQALIVSGAAIVVLVFLLSLLVWDAPAASTAVVAEPSSARPWSMRELLRERDFWLIALSIALLLGVDGAALSTITPYALDRGFSMTQATFLMTVTTVSAIGGKLAIAWFIDRMDLRLLIAVTGLFGIVLSVTIFAEPGYAVLAFVSGLTGLAIGGTYPLSNAIVAQRFGVISLGAARGLMSPLTAVLASACLYEVGALHDRHGHYRYAFMVLALASAMAMVLIFGVRRACGGDESAAE